MGLPVVYEKLRPLILGFDLKTAYKTTYDQLQMTSDDVLVDIGCGMGNALDYLDLNSFSEYHGVDTDETALMQLKRHYDMPEKISLYNRPFSAEDAVRINPSKVCMCGLLHHLDNAQARQLFDSVAQSKSLKKIVTQDPFYGEGNYIINNLLTRLDRGAFGRKIAGYQELIPTRLVLQNDIIYKTGYFVKVYVMVIQPIKRAAEGES
jgi:16S rRNA A1518/A1519 N6-dimethyltransferase RsmA/KsgA/DIM1 with predicted DNA glycosylase/AP lyase activity